MSSPVIQLAGLQTENRNARTTAIDRVSTLELCRILNREDRDVPSAVERCIPVIADVIDVLSERVRKGGRVFYIGAGTSGRLGVLDASEIPPTYSAPSGQFIALIAGGDVALRHAQEGAEDDPSAASRDLSPYHIDPEVDSLIGIASSGRTPYVLGGLSYFKSLSAVTVALVCVAPSAAREEGNADYVIEAVTGPEVVTGSTRMKAGTAMKMVLNMISTGIMVRLGKTFGNLMIDVKATNLKLKQRARNILRFVVGVAACTRSDRELDDVLERCGGSVKLAAAALVLDVSVAEAEERLWRHGGVLASVFEEEGRKKKKEGGDEEEEGGRRELVLCVDAGGTSCKAVVMTRGGEMGLGAAGPCNVTNIGLEAAMATISKAVQEALHSCEATKGQSLDSVMFSSAWVGMAGYGRPWLTSAIDSALFELLNLSPGSAKLRITTDIDILPASLTTPNTSEADLDSIVVLVAGTGAIATSYSKETSDGKESFRRTHRAGGWGHLLGDDGSGYGIGREALRSALRSVDLLLRIAREEKEEEEEEEPVSKNKLSNAIFDHFRETYPESKPDEDLLSTILAPAQEGENATLATTKRIAGVSRVVLSLASASPPDEEAKQIVDSGVQSLVDLVALLVRAGVDPARSGLVLAGGMMKEGFYRGSLMKRLEERFGGFKKVENVDQPAVAGARYLLGRL
ncbi:putative glucokinase regulator family protein [Xylariaceae sp. FL0594]|nr:putative glucokinase regulator family protein [Xylariaceae sp. FL0594]